jgi:hypothetical protein
VPVITTCNLTKEHPLRNLEFHLRWRFPIRFASGGFRWLYWLAQSEFPSFPVAGTDGNQALLFFPRLFPEKRLQKSNDNEMMIESKLGA